MSNLAIDLAVLEEMRSRVNENFGHFVKPFETMKNQGVWFDRFQIEEKRIDDY